MNPVLTNRRLDAERELDDAKSLPEATVRQMDFKLQRIKACHEKAADAANLCRIDLLTHHVGDLTISRDAADKGPTVGPQERNRTETVAGIKLSE